MDMFVQQIEIAEQLRKPMVIHCVRAFNELMALRKQHPLTPWVVHGFVGSLPLCHQLLDHAIDLSFGAALLDRRRAKVRNTFVHTDLHRLFLETDDSGADISAIYHEAALLHGCCLSDLTEAIKNHYLALFNQ